MDKALTVTDQKRFIAASCTTLEKNQGHLASEELAWSNNEDFELANMGLIHQPQTIQITDNQNNIVWDTTSFDGFLSPKIPDSTHPSLWRLAQLNNIRGLFKVTERIYQIRGIGLANMTFIESDTGYIVIDTLNTVEIARYALELFFRFRPSKPIVCVVYSHSHSDHWGGIQGIVNIEQVKQAKTKIIASENFTNAVTKEAVLTGEGLNSRNAYMYGEKIPKHVCGNIDTGLGKATEGGRLSFIEPTDIISNERETRIIDGIKLVFQYAPGEAPTGLHVYVPELKTMHIADNCYSSLHNVYTIRGCMQRDAMQWSNSIKNSLNLGEIKYLIGGHHWPRVGVESIHEYLTNQADTLKYMHDQTLRMANHGYNPAEIAQELKLPPELSKKWYLRGYYGTVEQNVRGIYNYYFGWYDGNPATLNPPSPQETATKMIQYMGGVKNVIQRVKEDIKQGNYRWVVQVLDAVLTIEPGNEQAKEIAANAYTQLAYRSENATWRNAYLSAADEIINGLPKDSPPRCSPDVIKKCEPDVLFQYLAIRLNGTKAAGKDIKINWVISDRHEHYSIHVVNAVLNFSLIERHDAPAITIQLPHWVFLSFILGEINSEQFVAHPNIKFKTKVSNKVQEFCELFDIFPNWFSIASHRKK